MDLPNQIDEKAPVGIFYDPACLLHENGPTHPERPDRLRALIGLFDALGGEGFAIHATLPEAAEAEIARVHAAEHIERVRSTCAMGPASLDPDTGVVPESWPAALKAAAAGGEACRRVLAGELRRAFCAVRPPGHHAEPDRAMGFCLFNNIAIAAAGLLAGGLRRVAIVDFDVHHGNGTQAAFWEHPDVLFASCHQMPLYPGSGAAAERGAGEGEALTLNRPLTAGAGDVELIDWLSGDLAAALRDFGPEFLLVSAGFDGHADDPLAGLAFSGEGFGEAGRILAALAEEICRGRLVAFLEGGYDLDSLVDSSGRFLLAL